MRLRIASNSGRQSSLVSVELGAHDALAADGVEDREVELLVGGAELDHQIEHFVDDFGRTRVRSGRSC